MWRRKAKENLIARAERGEKCFAGAERRPKTRGPRDQPGEIGQRNRKGKFIWEEVNRISLFINHLHEPNIHLLHDQSACTGADATLY